MKIKTVLSFAVLVLCFNFTPSAHATYGVADELGLSPFWDFKTIETEHFRITFPVELTDTAQKTAGYLEEAHSLLSPRLKWAASYRANILVIDNEDQENGLTTPEARFGIALYVNPPDNWESIYYYDNWLRELCIHEYTHFLNMDTTTGLYVPLRYIFGDILLPSTLWPTWMLEGLAVYMETRLTHAGRGRSPYYEMILRSAVQEGVLDSSKFLTLSKINPSYPYYPGGETVYTFGYQLMNQAAKTRAPGNTADGSTPLRASEDALGEMSYRSGGRVPFFINGNLENITGKSWYQTWDDFIAATRIRVGKELEIIRSKSVTPFKRFTEKGFTVLGPRYSPDHKWLAYTQDSLEDTSSALYLKNLQTGKTLHAYDKTAGATLSFTPDSKTIISSRLHRMTTYYLYSDLDVYDIKSGDHYFLTDRLRARDPSVSPDGKEITFTVTKDATTSLAVAPLIHENGQYKLGPVQILFKQAKLDRVATPEFSPNGKRIAFSFHKNGDLGEEIRVFNLDSKLEETVASNAHFNRFPSWDNEGNLYFVSDITGVDNLYRSNRPSKIEMLSNLETGMQFPYFYGDSKKYLGTVFSTQGYDVAEFDLPATPFKTAELQMPDVPAPALPPADVEPTKIYPVKNYSIWPTILPRSWAPIFVSDGNGIYAGGEIAGFDQVDRQRYLFVGAYDSFTQSWDSILHYENRMLGPTLEATSSIYTSAVGSTNGVLDDYQRTEKFTVDAYYTFQWTYSSLTPMIQLNEQRDFLHVPGVLTSDGDIVAKDAWVPHVDGSLAYTDEENSRIAIAPESGRFTLGGARAYQNGGDRTWKGLLTDSENIEFGMSHVVLSPSFKGSYVSHTSSYGPANVLVQGRYSNQVLNSMPVDNFDQIAIRGYPLKAFYARAATVYGLDLRFPILRIYDGLGTDPAYLNYLYGFTFGEATYFPAGDIKPTILPSAGGGLRLTTELLNYVPLTFSVEYHNGFKQDAGGTGEFFFQILAAALTL